MTRSKRKVIVGNGTPLTVGLFKKWEEEHFIPHVEEEEAAFREVAKQQKEHLVCVKKQLKEIQDFILPPANDSLQAQADKNACRRSPLVDLIRRTIWRDMWKVGAAIIAIIAVVSSVMAWLIEHRWFIQMLRALSNGS